MSLLEAVRHTLQREPNIQLAEQQIQIAKGAVQQAAGQFDFRLASALTRAWTHLPRSQLDFVQLGHRNIDDATADITTYELRLNKQFRTGIEISPGIELNRFADNLDQEHALNRANVSFLIRVPLLRGFGRVATEAVEQAARLEQEVALLDRQQVIASRILQTATAFWNLLAAQRQLETLRISESQAADLVRAVRELVRVGELPASELRQAEADQAARAAARISGEHQEWIAREHLALAIGWENQEMHRPPFAAADFPGPTTNATRWNENSHELLTSTLQRRADYLSALRTQRATEVLEAAARQNLKPQLDLNLEVGYAGMEEGSHFHRYYQAANPRLAAGPNLIGTINFEWPFRNRSARGLLLQREAARIQNEIRVAELARTIHSGILVARSELSASQRELEQAEAAAQNFRLAVRSEQEKVRLGTATILDVINLTDRFNDAQLRAISARAKHATAVVRWRFETGLLIQRGATIESPLTVEDLVTLPEWNRTSSP